MDVSDQFSLLSIKKYFLIRANLRKRFVAAGVFGAIGFQSIMMQASATTTLDDFEFDDDVDQDIPVVLTAVRLKQLQSDVPASVTVLEGQMLQDLGIKDISEALRLVPGIMVGYDANNKVSVVQYHGGPASLPRNLQVLLNGRSVYMSSLSTVDWQSIPVAIEDISRIEVVRGPNSSSYGSNAYQAIVNILTKHPADDVGTQVKRIQGNNGVKENHFRQSGGWGHTDYRFSLVQKNDAGISYKDYDTSYTATFLDSQFSHKLKDNSEMLVSAVYQVTDKPITGITIDDIENEDREKELEHTEVGAQWEKVFSAKHKLKINAFMSKSDHKSEIYVSGLPNAFLDEQLGVLYSMNPDFANAVADNDIEDFDGEFTAAEYAIAEGVVTRYLSDPGTFSGVIDNTIVETRYDIELEDTLVVGDHWTFVIVLAVGSFI